MGRAIGLLACLWCVGGLEAGPPPDAADMARADWDYRESLAAIRDWDAVLAGGAEALGVDGDVPMFPVPSDGRDVPWPNPIPARLIPPGEAAASSRSPTTASATARCSCARTAPRRRYSRSGTGRP